MTADIASLTNGNISSGQPMKDPSKELGKEDFMKLLLAQLSQQDPMNPQDSQEFVAQLTQFASLEGLGNIGTKLDQLVTITGASNAANAVSLLGKDVRINGNKIAGPATVYYELASPAQTVKVEVRDKDNKVVKVIDKLPASMGIHELKIEDLEKGEYTFRVEAFDSGNKEVKSQLSLAERVKGVNFADNVPILLMESGIQMKASDVVEIRQPGQVF